MGSQSVNTAWSTCCQLSSSSSSPSQTPSLRIKLFSGKSLGRLSTHASNQGKHSRSSGMVAITGIVAEEGYEDCSGFKSDEAVEGPFEFKTSTAGTYYFACGVGGHCKFGNQKAIVTVDNSC